MLFLCGMTGCIILVDHLHDEGAFHSKSPIRVRCLIIFISFSLSDQAGYQHLKISSRAYGFPLELPSFYNFALERRADYECDYQVACLKGRWIFHLPGILLAECFGICFSPRSFLSAPFFQSGLYKI